MNRIDAPTKTKSKAEVTRGELVNAAIEVFAERHFFDAKITDICGRAGKSNGLFYRYFENKHDIFATCVEKFFDQLVELEPDGVAADIDPAGATDISIEAYWWTYKRFYAVVAGLYEIGFTDEKIATVWRRIRRDAMRRFVKRIAEQQKLGKCSGLNAELAASALFSMLEFSCFNWNSGKLDFAGRAVSDDEAIRTLAHLIRNGLELEPNSQQMPRGG